MRSGGSSSRCVRGFFYSFHIVLTYDQVSSMRQQMVRCPSGLIVSSFLKISKLAFEINWKSIRRQMRVVVCLVLSITMIPISTPCSDFCWVCPSFYLFLWAIAVDVLLYLFK